MQVPHSAPITVTTAASLGEDVNDGGPLRRGTVSGIGRKSSWVSGRESNRLNGSWLTGREKSRLTGGIGRNSIRLTGRESS